MASIKSSARGMLLLLVIAVVLIAQTGAHSQSSFDRFEVVSIDMEENDPTLNPLENRLIPLSNIKSAETEVDTSDMSLAPIQIQVRDQPVPSTISSTTITSLSGDTAPKPASDTLTVTKTYYIPGSGTKSITSTPSSLNTNSGLPPNPFLTFLSSSTTTTPTAPSMSPSETELNQNGPFTFPSSDDPAPTLTFTLTSQSPSDNSTLLTLSSSVYNTSSSTSSSTSDSTSASDSDTATSASVSASSTDSQPSTMSISTYLTYVTATTVATSSLPTATSGLATSTPISSSTSTPSSSSSSVNRATSLLLLGISATTVVTGILMDMI